MSPSLAEQLDEARKREAILKERVLLLTEEIRYVADCQACATCQTRAKAVLEGRRV